MCRWFAYISPTEPCLLQDVLVTPAHSLIKQVEDHFLPKLLAHLPDNSVYRYEADTRNKLFNIDGFGVAFYTDVQAEFASSNDGGRPILYKTTQPPLHDLNFRSLAANTSTKTLFAHIRAATDTPIVSVNNHPFAFGRHVIMHNGTVAAFKSIARDVANQLSDNVYANIAGSTDSEHFAALYMTNLAPDRTAWDKTYSLQEMKSALFRALNTIFTIQKSRLGGDKASANSLNVAVTDGEKLITIRVRNHATEQPPSLYWSKQAGVTLNSKFPGHPNGGENPRAVKNAEEHGLHVIVASEPSTYKEEDWTLIGKNSCLSVGEGGVHIEDIDIPEHLMSTVNSL